MGVRGEHELNILFSVILMSILLILTLIGVLLYAFWCKSRQIISDFDDFIRPGKDGKSELAGFVGLISQQFGTAIAMEIKTTLMGKASGQARLESAVMGDIASDQLESQNPLIAGLLSSFPTLKKRLLKNPELLGMIASKLPGMSGQPQNGGASPPNLYKF